MNDKDYIKHVNQSRLMLWVGNADASEKHLEQAEEIIIEDKNRLGLVKKEESYAVTVLDKASKKLADSSKESNRTKKQRNLLDIHETQLKRLKAETKKLKNALERIQSEKQINGGCPILPKKDKEFSFLFLRTDPFRYEVRAVINNTAFEWLGQEIQSFQDLDGTFKIDELNNRHQEVAIEFKRGKFEGTIMCSSLGVLEACFFGDISEKSDEVASQLFEIIQRVVSKLYHQCGSN